MAEVPPDTMERALDEIRDACASRPLLLMELRELIAETLQRKDGLTGLSMRSLLHFGKGELREEFDEGVKSIEEHCQRYPYRVEPGGKDGEKVVTEPREIVLTLKITPIVTTVQKLIEGRKGTKRRDTLEITQYEIQGTVKAAKPHYKSRPVRALPRAGQIQFNPDAPDNPMQETIDFDGDEE